jgi:hypothetical protein
MYVWHFWIASGFAFAMTRVVISLFDKRSLLETRHDGAFFIRGDRLPAAKLPATYPIYFQPVQPSCRPRERSERAETSHHSTVKKKI